MLSLPQSNADIIWYAAWSSLLSGICALSNTDTAHFAVVPISVLITSLNYWSNPVIGSWNQIFDITVVFFGLIYQTCYAFYYYGYYNYYDSNHYYGCKQYYGSIYYRKYLQLYIYFIGLSLVCYLTGHIFYQYQQIWLSTYAHASIHIVANMANFALYTGVNRGNKMIL